MEEVVDSIVSSVSKWESKREEFDGVRLEGRNRSWTAIVKVVCCAKNMLQVSWVSPLVGILKLNFDGSFAQTS